MTLAEAIILSVALIVIDWLQERRIRKLEAQVASAVQLAIHAHRKVSELEEVEVEVEEACGCERCVRVERERWN